MKTNRHLIISGILFTVVLFLWPIFMAISQPNGNEEEQFKWILDNLTVYKVQFFFALLLAPSIIYLMLPAAEYVGEFLSTFKDYPPRAKAASFSLDQVMEQLTTPTNN
jgi:hypothetical protein